MSHTDRDKSVERLLRKTLRAPASSAAPNACLDGETLGAFTDGALPPTDFALVEAHLSSCARCQELLAAFVRTEPVPSAESLWQRWRLRWLVPIAAAATTVAIWIAVPTDQNAPVSDALNPRQELPTPSPAEAPAAAAPPVGSTLEKSETSDRDAPPGPGNVRPAPVDQVEELNAIARQASEREAPRSTDESNRRESDAATTRDSKTGLTLNETVTVAVPEAAATGNPAERREAAVQRRASTQIEIVSPSPVNRWRVLASTVERSTTGGKTWEPALVTAPTELTAGSSPSPAVCWLVGRGGNVRLTVDGTRFHIVPFPEMVDLVGVRASSAASADVTTVDGRRFRTEDQGKTWNRLLP